MLKNIFWALVMVTIAACAVLLGEGFTPPFPSPTATAVIDQTEIPFPTEIIVPTTEITEVVPTATEIVIPPTATFVPPTVVPPTVVAPTATFTSTAVPPTATFTPTAVPPTATLAPTAITEKFTLQAATPIFMINFVHLNEGCKWQGVAGQVFDATGAPLINYIIKVVGTYNGKNFSQIGITGMVAGDPYGIGGYEIVLGSSAIASMDLLTIQLFDSQGKPVTNPLAFSTSANCSQNLVLINFISK